MTSIKPRGSYPFFNQEEAAVLARADAKLNHLRSLVAQALNLFEPRSGLRHINADVDAIMRRGRWTEILAATGNFERGGEQ